MSRSNSPSRLAAAGLIGAALVAGCRRADPPPNNTGSPRIVSLSPAISRTLVDFDLQGNVVGRSAWCRSLDPAIPVAGDLYDIDYERLIRLDPTHVLVQPPSTGIDPMLLRVARDNGWIVGRWTFNTIDDIERMLREVPAVLYPAGGAGREAAAARAARLLNRLAAALTPGRERTWTGRTLLVADTEPAVLVFGHGTYLHEVLAALGGANATDARGWAELSLEDVLRLDPEAIIVVRDGERSDVPPEEAAGPLWSLDTTARRDGRIEVLWHADSMLPSSAVIEVAGAMREVLARLAETAP